MLPGGFSERNLRRIPRDTSGEIRGRIPHKVSEWEANENISEGHPAETIKLKFFRNFTDEICKKK